MRILIVLLLVGCGDNVIPCEGQPATKYDEQEISCSIDDEDGVMVSGECRKRCSEIGDACSGEKWRTFVTFDYDTCTAGHVCYCEAL